LDVGPDLPKGRRKDEVHMPAEEFGEGAFRAIADELVDEFCVGCVHLTG
jgi:hypothetical protein